MCNRAPGHDLALSSNRDGPDERRPHSGSDVWINFAETSAQLSPSVTLTLPIYTGGVYFFVQWRSMGPQVNYSSRFYLVLDGGDVCGQTEFWLTVWNWS